MVTCTPDTRIKDPSVPLAQQVKVALTDVLGADATLQDARDALKVEFDNSTDKLYLTTVKDGERQYFRDVGNLKTRQVIELFKEMECPLRGAAYAVKRGKAKARGAEINSSLPNPLDPSIYLIDVIPGDLVHITDVFAPDCVSVGEACKRLSVELKKNRPYMGKPLIQKDDERIEKMGEPKILKAIQFFDGVGYPLRGRQEVLEKFKGVQNRKEQGISFWTEKVLSECALPPIEQLPETGKLVVVQGGEVPYVYDLNSGREVSNSESFINELDEAYRRHHVKLERVDLRKALQRESRTWSRGSLHENSSSRKRNKTER